MNIRTNTMHDEEPTPAAASSRPRTLAPRVGRLAMPSTRRAAETVFRVLSSLIFVVAGAQHLLAPDRVARRLAAAPLGYLATWAASPVTLVHLAGVVLLVGGVALMLGLRTRLAALALIGVLVPITLTVQVGAEELGPLFKNIAILGALIHFAVLGDAGVSVARLVGRHEVSR